MIYRERLLVQQGKEISFQEAIEWGKTRKIIKSDSKTIYFEDNSSIHSESHWTGPISEDTPDIMNEPPTFTLIYSGEIKNVQR